MHTLQYKVQAPTEHMHKKGMKFTQRWQKLINLYLALSMKYIYQMISPIKKNGHLPFKALPCKSIPIIEPFPFIIIIYYQIMLIVIKLK
jgi:hypothetical protein